MSEDLNYETILEELGKKRGMRMDFEAFRATDRDLGSPSQSFRAIHVAGTNGKGTVTLKIAEGLTKLGYKTGMYTSPHIHTCRERIQIDGEMIPPEKLTHHLTRILELSRFVNFFEILTLAAFLYFREEKVDFAVIETGIGGKFDPTNIVTPKLSVITSISLDHLGYLGNSIEEIAAQKAGIIKPGIPALLGYSAVRKEMYKRGFEVGAPLYFMPPIADWEKENEEMAKEALKILFPGITIPRLESTMPCRYEWHDFDGLDLVFDIAHNPEAMKRLFHKVEMDYPSKPIYVLFNMSRDKDHSFLFGELDKRAEGVFFYKDSHPRLLKEEELPDFIRRKNFSLLELFLREAREKKGIVLVTGSVYIMKGVKDQLDLSSDSMNSKSANISLTSCLEG